MRAVAASRQSIQAETSRLSLQHSLWVAWLDGRIFSAPLLPNVHSVADLGCGSGAWTLAFATQFPSAEVLGVDLTPPENLVDLPNNCTFVRANIEDEWAFVPSGTEFDFIYARMLANGIHDWPKLFARCFELLRPGGWLELPDVRVASLSAKDGSTTETSPALKWFELFRAAAARTGIDPFADEKHGQRLHEAGFVEIQGMPVEWLVGGASASSEKERQIGDVHLGVIQTLITVTTKSLLQYEPGVHPEEVGLLAEEAKADLSRNQASRGFFMHL